MAVSHKVLITRPLADATAFADRLSAYGIESILFPILSIEPLPPTSSPYTGHAVILTSKHAAKLLPAYVKDQAVRIYCVGESTAQTAHNLGYINTFTASESAQHLASCIMEKLPPMECELLYLRGEDIAYDIASKLQESGYRVHSHIIYKAVPTGTVPAEIQTSIAKGECDIATFFSARTARLYNQLAVKPASPMQAVCMSEAVADCLHKQDWSSITVAETPTVHSMCQSIIRIRNKRD